MHHASLSSRLTSRPAERQYDPRPYDSRYSRGDDYYARPRRPRYEDDYRGPPRDYDRGGYGRDYDRGGYGGGGGRDYDRRYDDRRY